jgi:hypothetical protein
MAIKNPARFGLKTFLIGAAIALTLGVCLVASGICPPLVVMPAMLIFIMANSPIFAWAGAYAGIAAISALSVFTGVATAAVLETVDRVASAVWRLGKWLTGTSKEETTASTGTGYAPSSYGRMPGIGGSRSGSEQTRTTDFERRDETSPFFGQSQRQLTANTNPLDDDNDRDANSSIRL